MGINIIQYMNKTKIRIFLSLKNSDNNINIIRPNIWTIGVLNIDCNGLEELLLMANEIRTRYEIQYE